MVSIIHSTAPPPDDTESSCAEVFILSSVCSFVTGALIFPSLS